MLDHGIYLMLKYFGYNMRALLIEDYVGYGKLAYIIQEAMSDHESW